MRDALVVETCYNGGCYRLACSRFVGYRGRCNLAKTGDEQVNGFAGASGIRGAHVAAVRPYCDCDGLVAVGAGEDTGRVELDGNRQGRGCPTRSVEHNRRITNGCLKRYLNGHGLGTI